MLIRMARGLDHHLNAVFLCKGESCLDIFRSFGLDNIGQKMHVRRHVRACKSHRLLWKWQRHQYPSLHNCLGKTNHQKDRTRGQAASPLKASPKSNVQASLVRGPGSTIGGVVAWQEQERIQEARRRDVM
jgi:hypothetical protein